MKYKNREIEIGEKVVVFGDAGKNVVAKYVKDEKVELVTPVFEFDGEEIRGYECYWIPVKEAEEGMKEENYNIGTANFNKRITRRKEP